MLLRGANDYMLDEMDRSLHDAFCIVKRVLENERVVAGAWGVGTGWAGRGGGVVEGGGRLWTGKKAHPLACSCATNLTAPASPTPLNNRQAAARWRRR